MVLMEEHTPPRVGAALENFPARKRKKNEKSVGSTYAKKKPKKRHEAKFIHPQNRRFPLSTMMANIHLCVLLALAT
jgi:hypothetical protein